MNERQFLDDEMVVFLETEAATITALVNEIERGDNDTKDFLNALRQVGYRMRLMSLEVAKY